jgi:hypothetical protein
LISDLSIREILFRKKLKNKREWLANKVCFSGYSAKKKIQKEDAVAHGMSLQTEAA